MPLSGIFPAAPYIGARPPFIGPGFSFTWKISGKKKKKGRKMKNQTSETISGGPSH
jgi:hypothetical protein